MLQKHRIPGRNLPQAAQLPLTSGFFKKRQISVKKLAQAAQLPRTSGFFKNLISEKQVLPQAAQLPQTSVVCCMRANTDCTSILPVSKCQLCRQSADRLLVRRASKKMAAHVKRGIGEAKGYDYICVYYNLRDLFLVPDEWLKD